MVRGIQSAQQQEKEEQKMSKGINKVMVLGRCGAEPEIRYTNNGDAVCNLRLAVNEKRKTAEGWEDHCEWVHVSIFGKTAEAAGKYLSKGSHVFIEGRMQTRKWTDKQGQDRWTTEVVSQNAVFLGGGDNNAEEDDAPRARQRPSQRPAGGKRSQIEDDLPF